MPAEITAFFASYINGYDQFDAAQIASHYSVPSVVLDSTGVTSFAGREPIESKMSAYCETFKQSGYTSASFECSEFLSLGDSACFVDLLWKVVLADRVLEYKTAYVLHHIDGTWKISNATVYGH